MCVRAPRDVHACSVSSQVTVPTGQLQLPSLRGIEMEGRDGIAETLRFDMEGVILEAREEER